MTAQSIASNENLSKNSTEEQEAIGKTSEQNPFESPSQDPKLQKKFVQKKRGSQTITQLTQLERGQEPSEEVENLAKKKKRSRFKVKLKNPFRKKKTQKLGTQQMKEVSNVSTGIVVSEHETEDKRHKTDQNDQSDKERPRRTDAQKLSGAVDVGDEIATTSVIQKHVVRDTSKTEGTHSPKTKKFIEYKSSQKSKKLRKGSSEDNATATTSQSTAVKQNVRKMGRVNNDDDYDVNPFLCDDNDVANTDSAGDQSATADEKDGEHVHMLPGRSPLAANLEEVDGESTKEENGGSSKKQRKRFRRIFRKRRKSKIDTKEPVRPESRKASVNLQNITKDVEETKRILEENITSQLRERKEKLDDLVVKADELEQHADEFRTRARKVKHKYQCCPCCHCPDCWHRLVTYLRRKSRECARCCSCCGNENQPENNNTSLSAQ